MACRDIDCLRRFVSERTELRGARCWNGASGPGNQFSRHHAVSLRAGMRTALRPASASDRPRSSQMDCLTGSARCGPDRQRHRPGGPVFDAPGPQFGRPLSAQRDDELICLRIGRLGNVGVRRCGRSARVRVIDRIQLLSAFPQLAKGGDLSSRFHAVAACRIPGHVWNRHAAYGLSGACCEEPADFPLRAGERLGEHLRDQTLSDSDAFHCQGGAGYRARPRFPAAPAYAACERGRTPDNLDPGVA